MANALLDQELFILYSSSLTIKKPYQLLTIWILISSYLTIYKNENLKFGELNHQNYQIQQICIFVKCKKFRNGLCVKKLSRNSNAWNYQRYEPRGETGQSPIVYLDNQNVVLIGLEVALALDDIKTFPSNQHLLFVVCRQVVLIEVLHTVIHAALKVHLKDDWLVSCLLGRATCELYCYSFIHACAGESGESEPLLTNLLLLIVCDGLFGEAEASIDSHIFILKIFDYLLEFFLELFVL